MENNDIVREYRTFLIDEVTDYRHEAADYCLLLNTLFDIPFRAYVEMDNNRIDDALDMRIEYISNQDYHRIDYSAVKNRFVSCLEVLISLAKRMENDILCDPMEEIDHSSDHFWMFLRNLDVEKYTNDRFLEAEIRLKVEKFIRREYKKNGVGSIFPVKSDKIDMRKLEIWDQMNRFLMENY